MNNISGGMHEQTEDDDELACPVCENTGEYIPAESDILLPCPSCERGIWNDVLETADDARREQMREDAS